MPGNTSKKWLAPGILLLGIVAAAGLVFTKPEAKTAKNEEVARRVSTLTVQTGTHHPVLPVFAEITTTQQPTLRSNITADVISVFFQAGQAVQKDNIIVQLDDKEAQLQLKQRTADVQDIQAQIDAELLEHKNQLYVIKNDKGKRAEHNREQIIKGHAIRLRALKAKLQKARAAQQLAELDIARTRISAPYHAVITETHIAAGDRVRPGDAIVSLYEPAALEATASLPNQYVAILRQALDNNKVIEAHTYHNGQKINAPLLRIDSRVNLNSGNTYAYFDLNNQSLPLGKHIDLNIQLPDEKDSLVVPNSALYGLNTVYKIIDQRLKAVQVKRLGDASSSQMASTLISSPELQSGDIILLTQLPNAVENLLVKPLDD